MATHFFFSSRASEWVSFLGRQILKLSFLLFLPSSYNESEDDKTEIRLHILVIALLTDSPSISGQFEQSVWTGQHRSNRLLSTGRERRQITADGQEPTTDVWMS